MCGLRYGYITDASIVKVLSVLPVLATMVSSPPLANGSRASKASSHGSNGGSSANLYCELAEIPVYTKAEFVKITNEPAGSRNIGK